MMIVPFVVRPEPALLCHLLTLTSISHVKPERHGDVKVMSESQLVGKSDVFLCPVCDLNFDVI